MRTVCLACCLWFWVPLAGATSVEKPVLEQEFEDDKTAEDGISFREAVFRMSLRIRDPRMAEVAEEAPDGMDMDEDTLLQIIDQGVSDGMNSSVPPDVMRRLEQWRQGREAERKAKKTLDGLQWVEGPATVTLDEIPIGISSAHESRGILDEEFQPAPIKLDIPEGYKFLSAKDADAFQRSQGVRAKGVAVLGSIEDDFVVLIECANIGHFDRDMLAVDLEMATSAIEGQYRNPVNTVRSLNKYIEMQSNPALYDEDAEVIEKPQWLVAPTVDPEHQIMQWVNTRPTGEPPVGGVARFGRARVVHLDLNANDLNSDAPGVVERAVELAKGIQFDAGERYADFKPNDARATITLLDLLSGGTWSKPSVPAIHPSAFEKPEPKSELPWYGVGLLLFLLGALLAERRAAKHKDERK